MTTTDRAIPSRPSTRSVKSRSSRPRFADQRDHHHIGRDAAREPRQKRRLAHARAGKETDPLPADQRQKRVEHGHAGGQTLSHRAALRGGGGRPGHRARLQAAQQRTAVQRAAQRIDDAAQPIGGGCDGDGADLFDPGADHQALGVVLGQDGGAGGGQADDLSPQPAGAGFGQDPVAQRGLCQAGDHEGATPDLGDAADGATRLDRGDFRAQRIEDASQPDLLLFPDYGF